MHKNNEIRLGDRFYLSAVIFGQVNKNLPINWENPVRSIIMYGRRLEIQRKPNEYLFIEGSKTEAMW